jgi:hypothetical protein
MLQKHDHVYHRSKRSTFLLPPSKGEAQAGIPSKVVAAELGVHEHKVGKWRRHFLKDSVEGLLDEARPGRPQPP